MSIVEEIEYQSADWKVRCGPLSVDVRADAKLGKMFLYARREGDVVFVGLVKKPTAAERKALDAIIKRQDGKPPTATKFEETKKE